MNSSSETVQYSISFNRGNVANSLKQTTPTSTITLGFANAS